MSTNGIKNNGFISIEALFSKYLMSCAQEIKFCYSPYLSTFRFNLDSSFKHKVFVDDLNCHIAQQTRERHNEVLTVLRSDFPGYNSAIQLQHLLVTGRYLVVRVMKRMHSSSLTTCTRLSIGKKNNTFSRAWRLRSFYAFCVK